jgi:hypothetical protein
MMIKFFRKIRYDLMGKNKTGQYLKYAIGEIVLVVIGILIALSINSWNENIKTHSEELELLHLVQNSIQDDLGNLEILQNTLINDITKLNRVLDFLGGETEYSDSLSTDFRPLTMNKAISFNQSAIKSFEAKGQIVKNDSLRYAIIDLHNDTYPRLQRALNNFRANLLTFYRPILKTRFIYPDDYFENLEYKPVNPDSLKNDLEFNNSVKSCKANFQVGLDRINIVINTILALNNAINEELN